MHVTGLADHTVPMILHCVVSIAPFSIRLYAAVALEAILYLLRVLFQDFKIFLSGARMNNTSSPNCIWNTSSCSQSSNEHVPRRSI